MPIAASQPSARACLGDRGRSESSTACWRSLGQKRSSSSDQVCSTGTRPPSSPMLTLAPRAVYAWTGQRMSPRSSEQNLRLSNSADSRHLWPVASSRTPATHTRDTRPDEQNAPVASNSPTRRA